MILLLIQDIETEVDRDRVLTLYSEHYALMKQKALKNVHDPDIADDLVQEAMIRIIKKIDVLRDLTSAQLLAYAIKSIQNLAIDHFRKQRKESPPLSFEEIEGLISSDEAFPDEALDNLEKEDIIIELGIALRKLPERDRQVLVCKYIFQYPDKKTAKTLGIKEDSVRMALTRARTKIRNILEQKVYCEEEKDADEPKATLKG